MTRGDIRYPAAMATLTPLSDRIWLHTYETARRVIDPADIYWLDADADDTVVRHRGRTRLRDIRRIAQLARILEPHGFVRVHHGHLVNARRILLVRKREGARDWELKLEPPVNRVLPVSRGYLPQLRRIFGDR